MRRRLAVGLTLIAAVLWGTSFMVNDAGVRLAHPAAFAFWRFAIAAVASVAIAVALRRFDPRVFADRLLWALAGLNAAGFLLQYVGQTLTTPARTALFVNANVVVVAVLSWLVLREAPRKRTLAAMAVALVGVVLLQSRGDVGAYAGGTPLGDIVVFVSGTCGAATFVLFPRLLARWNAWNLVAAIFVVTALLTLPVAAGTAGAGVLIPRAAWPHVAYAALATSTFAYTLWAFAMHRLSPTTSAVLLLLEVLVAAAISLALGRESFTTLAALGSALLLAAVVWLSVTPPPAKAADQQA